MSAPEDKTLHLRLPFWLTRESGTGIPLVCLPEEWVTDDAGRVWNDMTMKKKAASDDNHGRGTDGSK
jgi:hypothetical protein